jgi:hypothetical protein
MAGKPPVKLTKEQKERLKDPKFVLALRLTKPLMKKQNKQGGR